MAPALLFDLDETLVVEERAVVGAFTATARLAGERHRLDVAALATDARARARELFWAAPTHAYCRRIGISSWEGLWCRYEGEGAELLALREWAPLYRREAWRLALADQGVEDEPLATELGERFGAERRARHEPFAEAEAVLAQLGADHALALVTNGASCLQREKLISCGLAHHFSVIVASGDRGAAKPDPSIFMHALALLGGGEDGAVMIGDSFERDIEGALAAGLDAIWLNRDGSERPARHPHVREITTLTQLPAALAA